MSATNQTTHYELPLFIDTDRPGWLTDFNNAMTKIDDAIYSASQSGSGGETGPLKTINGQSLTGTGNIEVQDPLTFDNTPTAGSSNPVTSDGVFISLNTKQNTLTSGTNIKTINGQSILGPGNIEIDSTPATPTTLKTINGESLTGTGNINLQTPLVNGTSIKTINGANVLGSGNIAVQPTLTSGSNIKTINGQSLLGSGDITIEGGSGSLKTINGESLSGTGNISVLTPGQILSTDQQIVLDISNSTDTGVYTNVDFLTLPRGTYLIGASGNAVNNTTVDNPTTADSGNVIFSATIATTQTGFADTAITYLTLGRRDTAANYQQRHMQTFNFMSVITVTASSQKFYFNVRGRGTGYPGSYSVQNAMMYAIPVTLG